MEDYESLIKYIKWIDSEYQTISDRFTQLQNKYSRLKHDCKNRVNSNHKNLNMNIKVNSNENRGTNLNMNTDEEIIDG